MSGTPEYRAGGRSDLATVSALSAAAVLALFVMLAMSQNGWTFEYPLDDVYIHLAVAEQIARGGYGVNAGEAASAASSPLYPFLLTPFATTESQLWWPLAVNFAALIMAARLVGHALEEADLGPAGFWFALAAPVALAMYATAYSGMENMAHGAASLAVVLGLWRFARTGEVGVLLVIGTFLAPAFRFEGLALTTAAGVAVVLLGRPLAGAGLVALGALPVAAFAWFLTSLGLGPLPNSIAAKLADQGGAGEAGIAARALGTFSANIGTYGGLYLLGLATVALLVAASILGTDRRRAHVGLAVAAAGFAHLAFGATGWLDRYENYAVLILFAALALLLGTAARAVRIMVLTVALVGGVLTYGPYVPNNMANMQAIHRQQGQMARFAKEYLKAPVAVNDLGYVAWHNPDYVLDLWGLASPEALEKRLSQATGPWADALADAHDVRLAMIYDDWLAEALGPGWVPLGTLLVEAPGAFLGGPDVSFYARRGEDAGRISDLLEAWAKDLPEGAWFTFAGEEGRG